MMYILLVDFQKSFLISKNFSIKNSIDHCYLKFATVEIFIFQEISLLLGRINLKIYKVNSNRFLLITSFSLF